MILKKKKWLTWKEVFGPSAGFVSSHWLRVVLLGLQKGGGTTLPTPKHTPTQTPETKRDLIMVMEPKRHLISFVV